MEFDKTNDGEIQIKELEKIMIELKEEYSDELLAIMMKEADFDKDGKVSFDDFKKIINLY